MSVQLTAAVPPPNGQVPDRDNAPHIPASEAAQERILTDMPFSLGYKPQQNYWGRYSDGGPNLWEVLRDVEEMSAHPIVSIGMVYFRGVIQNAEFEVKASSAEVGKFALMQLRKFWGNDLETAQLAYEYGWGGFELCYEDKNRYLSYAGLLEFSARVSDVLTRHNDYIGLRVQNGGGDGQYLYLWGGKKNIPSKGLWLTHRKRYHRWHGRTQYWSAHKPWFELAKRDGTEEATCNAMYRFGVGGIKVRFPKGSEKAKRTEPGPDRQDHRDKALSFANGAKNGASVAMTSETDEHGNYVWDVTYPERSFDPSGLLTFDERWCNKVFFGLGVPPEVIQASDTGSGYSGRAIPKESFYVSRQNSAQSTTQSFVDQSLNPMVRWNFGPEHWVEVTVKPLLKSQAQQAGGMGQPGDQGAAGAPPPAPGAPPGALPPGPPGAGGAPAGGAPDLAAMFGGSKGTQTMALDPDGQRWISTNLPNGDNILVNVAGNPETINTIGLALPPIETEAIVSSVAPDPVEDIAKTAADGYARLVARVRKDLAAALRTGDPKTAADKIEEILRRHQPALSRLLADTRLAAALVGAAELIRSAPDDLDTLPPSGASVLEQVLHRSLKDRPQSEIDAVRVVLGKTEPDEPPEPVDQWSPPQEETGPLVAFPMIEEAAADLAKRRVMTRPDFDLLHASEKEGAFTVAGLATEAAIEKVRDASATAVAEGHLMPQFAQNVETDLGSGTFLSPAHMETVFRGAIMGGYANGQDKLLNDPRIGDYFPYVQRDTVNDQRRRPTHKALEKLGIQGTNIYRRDDPVFQKFRAPWDFNCRCGDTYITIRQAAAKGIVEAQEWLRTGVPPATPAFVANPPFEPPPGWYRLALESIGVQWLQVLSDITPHGHHGLNRYRNPQTHEIVGPGGQPRDAKPAPTAPRTDDVTAEEKPDETKHKFGSTQFDLADATGPHDQSSPLPELTRLASEIPHTHLAEDGREQHYHITALYGLHDDVTPQQVQAAVAGFGPVKVKLGKVSLFENEDDVLKVDVESDDLRRLNAKLANLPHTDTHGNSYNPHLTIAYLRKGFGAPFVGSTAVEGKELTFDTLVFSDVEKNRTEIPLSGTQSLAVQLFPCDYEELPPRKTDTELYAEARAKWEKVLA